MSASDPRPPAVLHVDLDGARPIFAAHGWSYGTGPDRLFASGMESALAFFARQGVRATLFAIAEDLDDPAKRALLRAAVDAGHEIASHTWTHRKLTSVPAGERAREIADSRRALEDALGVPVTGFRAPGFALDAAALRAVTEAGYGWDSSLFGGGPNPLGGETPRRPFRLAEAAQTLELPLPPFRPLPVPWHPSYALVLGRPWFRAGLGLARRGAAPLVMLFHLTDFADPDPAARGLLQQVFTLSFLSRSAKIARLDSMLASVRARHRIVTTAELLPERAA
ncbi:MAG: polysaccharide deacetylase family protein [Gemmatimonadota bacterium]|nr:polysaccharide deacetylase family protein [Gemmatimonadota bacterium]